MGSGGTPDGIVEIDASPKLKVPVTEVISGLEQGIPQIEAPSAVAVTNRVKTVSVPRTTGFGSAVKVVTILA
jgi:hypothetical protein